MQIPDEVLDKGLTPREFYLLATMYRIVDRWGDIDATMDELGELTKSSRTTLWRDMVSLEKHGLITKTRRKRNLGKLHKNNYRLCFQPETLATKTETEPRFTTETSTASTSNVSNVQSKQLVRNTSYFLEGDALVEEKSMNRWKDDDDEIGGFGLLEGEVPAVHKPAPVSKKSAKTRNLRPQAEWTAADVASEFSKRLYARITGVPAIINTDKLRQALATYRKRYGTTASFEMEVMEMFFGDERVVTNAKKTPHDSWKIFLKMLTTHGNRANDNLEMRGETKPLTATAEFVYASDGTEFDNSMNGRLELAEYEASLK